MNNIDNNNNNGGSSLQKQRNEFLIKHNRAGYNFHNTLVNARAKGFKSGDDFQDLENYFKWQNSNKNENIKLKENKTKLLKEYGYESEDWIGLAISAGHNGFNISDNPLQNMKNYLEYLKDLEKDKIILEEKKINILKKYSKNINSWHQYLVAARKHNFKSMNDLKDVENYFKYLNGEIINDNLNHILKHSQIPNINETHKKICKKYGFKYNNERNWVNYKKKAIKNGFENNDDGIIKYLKFENSKIIERERNLELFITYNILGEGVKTIDDIHPRTYTTYLKLAEKENQSLNEYLKSIYDKRQAKANIMLEFGFKPEEFPRKLAATRNARFRAENEIDDVRNLLISQIEKKLEKEALDNKRRQFMIDNGKNPNNWTNNVVSAHALGFNTGDTFKDLTNFWNFSLMKTLLNDINRIKNIKISNLFNIPIERIGNTLDFAHKAGFNFGNDEKDIKDYIIYRRKNEIRNNIKRSKYRQLARRFNIKINLVGRYLLNARNHGFNSEDDFKNLNDYFTFIEERMSNIDENDLFYKTKTKMWRRKHPDEVKFLEDNIIGFNNIKNRSKNGEIKIPGVYIWKINNSVFYVGESIDILDRLYDHMYNIQNFPEFLVNIIDCLKRNVEINNNGNRNSYNCGENGCCNDFTLSVEIKESNNANKVYLKDMESYYINALKPISQKCDGTDHIIHLFNRKFTLESFIII